jgi:hypothetical protein
LDSSISAGVKVSSKKTTASKYLSACSTRRRRAKREKENLFAVVGISGSSVKAVRSGHKKRAAIQKQLAPAGPGKCFEIAALELAMT